MQQNVQVRKEPVSQNAAYPRNLISEHHKCFLQFEEFPISVQSHCLPTLFIVGQSPKTGSAVRKLDGIAPYLYGQHVEAEENCVKMNIWYLHSDFPIRGCWWILHALCEFLQPAFTGGVKKKSSSLSKKKRRKQTFSGQWICLIPVLILWVFLVLCLALLVLCVCMHVHVVWLWRRLIKYSPVLLLHNAVTNLWTEHCLQTSSLSLRASISF